jgi:hypothetical protein
VAPARTAALSSELSHHAVPVAHLKVTVNIERRSSLIGAVALCLGASIPTPLRYWKRTHLELCGRQQTTPKPLRLGASCRKHRHAGGRLGASRCCWAPVGLLVLILDFSIPSSHPFSPLCVPRVSQRYGRCAEPGECSGSGWPITVRAISHLIAQYAGSGRFTTCKDQICFPRHTPRSSTAGFGHKSGWPRRLTSSRPRLRSNASLCIYSRSAQYYRLRSAVDNGHTTTLLAGSMAS